MRTTGFHKPRGQHLLLDAGLDLVGRLTRQGFGGGSEDFRPPPVGLPTEPAGGFQRPPIAVGQKLLKGRFDPGQQQLADAVEEAGIKGQGAFGPGAEDVLSIPRDGYRSGRP